MFTQKYVDNLTLNNIKREELRDDEAKKNYKNLSRKAQLVEYVRQCTCAGN